MHSVYSVCYTPQPCSKCLTQIKQIEQIKNPSKSVYSVCDNPQLGSKCLTQIKQMEQIKKSFQICDNHEVLATEREPEGPAQRAQQSVC